MNKVLDLCNMLCLYIYYIRDLLSMHPQHNPEIRDALPPASLGVLDNRARTAVNHQLDRLERRIGEESIAKLPEHPDIPLQGFHLSLGDGSIVDLPLDVNAGGEVIGEDRTFIDARSSLAVLRSRERSRGSRVWNFAFRKNRTQGYGHGWDIDQAETVYHDLLASFIARKVQGHIGSNQAHDNQDHVTEIVSRAIIQEQQQMSSLERMASELKSGGTGFLNGLRKNKAFRIAAGIGLGVGAAVAGASGLWAVAIPLFGARAALSASGGYMLGRTGWDAFQGIRTRGLPNDDIRMASHSTHDISGRLNQPEGAFHRFINILGAEARVGSSMPRRQQLIHRQYNSDLVRRYYTYSIDPATGNPNHDALDFTNGHSEQDIEDRLSLLYASIIRPRQDERLKSDQTQSRKRHIAGLVGGALFAGLTVTGAIEVLNVGVGVHHLGDGITGHVGTQHAGLSPKSNQIAPHVSGKPSSGGTEIVIPPGSQISINESAAVAPMAHDTISGQSTSVLDVHSGGGFISTFESQYGLTPSQANDAYNAMSDQLRSTAGTYLHGTDIRISAPGLFHLSSGEQTVLEHHLAEYGKLPVSSATNGSATGISNITITGSGHSTIEISPPSTIDINGDSVSVAINDPVGISAHTSSLISPDSMSSHFTTSNVMQTQTHFSDLTSRSGFPQLASRTPYIASPHTMSSLGLGSGNNERFAVSNNSYSYYHLWFMNLMQHHQTLDQLSKSLGKV